MSVILKSIKVVQFLNNILWETSPQVAELTYETTSLIFNILVCFSMLICELLGCADFSRFSLLPSLYAVVY